MFSQRIQKIDAKRRIGKTESEDLSSISTLYDKFAREQSSPRTVLLLQGLMGPLFRRLGQELMRAGHKVHKVNFNGGDRLYWRLPNGINYRGTLEDWPLELRLLIEELGVTDVVLFGDCRPHHAAATAVCRETNVRVHVFEEGYIRPDWVTLELDGVNGHSKLGRDPEWYRQMAKHLPALPEHQQVASSFRRRATEGFLYNFADVLSRWAYPHWSNHRPWHPLIEGVGWARKLWRRKKQRIEAEALMDHLAQLDDPYYLFPLQLASDAQIRLHSPFSSMTEALTMVLKSFAQHAPPRARLVVKEHPLDNGVRDWQAETKTIASMLGIADRVDYLAWGDIVPVARKAKGMVTINSTSGTLALDMGRPVVVLGQAIFDMPDLTFQDGLGRFWKEATPPDQATFDAFRRVLIERCLIPGGFFSEEALASVVQYAVARFEG